MWLSSFSNAIYQRDCSFPIVYFWILCHKLIDHFYMCFFLGSLFRSIDLSVIMPVWCVLTNIIWNQGTCCLQFCSSFSRLLWLFRIFCGSLHFRIVCSISIKKCLGILIVITLNLYIAVSSMDILTILILPIYEQRISSYLFVSSFYFINVLQFSVYRFFTSLVKLIPKHYILFNAEVCD